MAVNRANRRPPIAACGCHKPSVSSGSHKRPSSHSTSAYEPRTKKLDSYKSPISPLVDELQNLEIDFPRTPSSINIPAARLPPRPPCPPAVKRDMRSPAQRVSTSCLDPEWRRKKTDCISQTREILDCVEGCVNAQTYRNSDSPGYTGHNKNSDPKTVNNGLSGTVVVEKKDETLIVHVKCPCGAGYEILFLGGISYYKLM